MSRRSLAFSSHRSRAGAAIVGLVGSDRALPPIRPRRTSRRSRRRTVARSQGLIAVSPVNKHVVWASGRGGTFAVTTDGGATWRAGVVPGAELLQFRDVEGVSDKVAYLMSIGNDPGDFRIYKTTDGGATWSLQFQNQNPFAFYDCFAFWTPKRGIAQSDAVNGQFPVDGRRTGRRGRASPATSRGRFPASSSSRSSGTCVATEGKKNAWAVTGGASTSRSSSRATAVTRGTPTTPRCAARRARAAFSVLPGCAPRDGRRRRSRSRRRAVRSDRRPERRWQDLGDHPAAAEHRNRFWAQLHRRRQGQAEGENCRRHRPRRRGLDARRRRHSGSPCPA